MKQITFLVLGFFLSLVSYSQNIFVKNKGQIIDFEGNLQSQIKFYSRGAVDIYFRKNGVTYIYKKSEFDDSKFKEGEQNKYDQYRLNKDYINAHKMDSTYFYRVDMDFLDANPDSKLIGLKESQDFNNYYFAHCPDGILNVKNYKKILYKDVYPKIDLEFYFSEDGLKYDIILHPGANLAQLKFKFPGLENIILENNEIIISSEIGDFKESLPKSFIVDGTNESLVDVNYQLNNQNEVAFEVEYDITKKLIIDPQVVWQTLYQESFGIGFNNPIESKGNQLVNAGYTFNAGFPTVNPGAGAYYQNAVAGSADIRIVQFDTTGARQWATYYGGTDYESIPDVAIDNSGRIVLSLATESTDIPTQNAGGYYDASYTPGTFSPAQCFVLRFNSSGVRDWGTHYDYVRYPMITVDNNDNIYILGESEYDNPPVQFLSGAYNQSTVALDGSASGPSDDIFIIKFNSSTSRIWATNLGSSSDEGIADLQCDNLNNLYILGYGDNYYGTGIITQSGGGYFDNQLGTGTGGSSADRGDILIYKFNSAGAMTWGTAFGGNSLEWAWRASSALKTDASNNVYICATTRSTDIPVTAFGSAYYDGTFSNPIGSGNPENHFIARFNSSTQLEWCTYWGDQSYNYSTYHGVQIEFNNANNMIVAVGVGNGNYYPTLNRSSSYNQGYQNGDVHIGEFDNNGSLVWGTYYGGSSGERLGELCAVENSLSFFMTNSWFGGSGALWVTPPSGAYYDGTVVSSPQMISKFSVLVCDSAENNTNSNDICEGTNKSLIGVPSGGTWSIVSGPGSIVGTTYSTGNIATDQVVIIRYEIDAPGCPDTIADITFTVNADPGTAVNTTSTTDICETDNKNLTGTPSGGTWSIVSGGGSIIGSTYNPPNITTNTSITIRYTISANGACPGSFDDVVFNVHPDTAANITSSGAAMCVGDIRILTGTPAGGNWSIISGGAFGNISGGNQLNATANGTITIQYSHTDSCGIKTDVQNITVSSVVMPNITNSLADMCVGDKRELTASPGGGTWSILNGPGSLGVNDTLIANAAGIIQVMYNVTSSCGSGTDTVNIVVNPTPTPSITSTNADLCIGSSRSLIGTPSGGFWTVISGPGSIIGSTLTGTSSGTVLIEYSVTQLGCTGVTTQNIVIVDTANADWIDPDTICESAGQVNLVSYLQPWATTGGVWTGAGVSGAIFDPTGLSGTSVTIKYKVGTFPCEDSVSYTIEVIQGVNASWTSPGNWCESSGIIDLDTLLNLTATPGGVWSGAGVSVSLFDPSGLSGNISIKYLISNGFCADSLIQSINVQSSPIAPIVSVSPDTICDGDSIIIIATGSGVGVIYNVYTSSIGGTLLGQTPLTQHPSVTTTYYVEAVGTNNCPNIGGRQPIQVFVNPTPNADAGLDQTICIGENANLSANGGATYNWNTGATSANITVSPSTSTTYTVTVIGSSGCISQDTVRVFVQTLSIADAQDDEDSLITGETKVLDIYLNDLGDISTIQLINGPYYGTGSIAGGLLTYTSNLGHVGVDSIRYQICDPICQNLCDTGWIWLYMDNDLTIPNGLSPNNDGLNDVFNILGLAKYPNNRLKIFNRWGNLIYQASPYLNDWRGQNNLNSLIGNEVVEGTYFFILELGKGFDTHKGYIELKK